LQVSPVDGVWVKPLIVLQALGVFAVPAFLFISGAFISYSSSQLSRTFLKSSLARILWPYVIWSGIFFALLFVAQGERFTAIQYVRHLVVGYPYHFVPLLAFWYVLSPVFVRYARQHPVALLLIVGAYQALLIAFRDPELFGLSQSLPSWTRAIAPPVLANTLADWALYFPLGLVLSLHDGRVRSHLMAWRWPIAGATLAVFGLGLLNAFDIVDAPLARFAAPLPMMLLLPVVRRTSIPLLRQFELVGRESYGIYLSHFVVINLLVVLVSVGGSGLPRMPIVLFPAFFAIALAVPVCLTAAMASVPATRSAYRYVFGTTPSSSSTSAPRPQPNVLPRATHRVERST